MPRQRKVVFAGRDLKDDEYFVLYVDVADPSDDVLYPRFAAKALPPRDEYFIKFPDGEIWALSPTAQMMVVKQIEDGVDFTYLYVKSPEWTGTAKGTREDLLREERTGL